MPITSANNQPALRQALSNIERFIFVRTDEEGRFLSWLQDNYGTKKYRMFKVWKSTLGTVLLKDYLANLDIHVQSWTDKLITTPNETQDANRFLRDVLTERNTRTNVFTIVLGGDNILNGSQPQLTRRLMDIGEQIYHSTSTLKTMIFVGHTLRIPAGMERMFVVVDFDLMSKDEISEYLETLIKANLSDTTQTTDDVKITKLIDIASECLTGMTKPEIDNTFPPYLQPAKFQGFLSNPASIESSIRTKRMEAIRKNPLLELINTNLTFANVGGCENLKRYLTNRKDSWSQEAKEFGVDRFKGVLLVGLPGNGKSLICKAVADEYKLPLIKFDPSKLFSGQVGASEQNMHRALDTMEKMAPCIVFVDEMEKGFAGMGSSNFSDAGTTSRVIGTFLNWMQECTKDVIFVATANDIQGLPPELIRRFDEVFFVGLPNATQRREIWDIHLKAKNRDVKAFDMDRLVKVSVDRSGSEIETAVKAAIVTAYNDGKRTLTTKDLVDACTSKPSLLITMRESLQGIINWVGKDETTGEGVRARFAHADDAQVTLQVS